MGQYVNQTSVVVYPFTRQHEGEEVIIGHLSTATFLVLPPDAVEILDYLAHGKTVGETQALYREKYGEVPDLDDLLSVLEQKGFVAPLGEHSSGTALPGIPAAIKPTQIRYHFANFPQPLAQQLFSRTALMLYGAVIGLALVAIARDPSLIPGWEAYFFKENATLMIVGLMALDGVALFLHEMAHLVAARSLGVFCRLGVSNRMWTLVAETDMTGVWSVPRQQRYLPFLAGPLLDMVCTALLTLIFFGEHRGWLGLPPVVHQLGFAWLLNYWMGLLWQCYFFVRTDFYYVVANFFRCKSLLSDTEVLMRNQLARWCRWVRRVDQSHIPHRERRIIRSYALLWLFGRAAAIWVLIAISLPLMWHYCVRLAGILAAGYGANPAAFIDALLMLALVCIPQGLGFWLWFRSFRSTQSSSR